MKGHLSHALFGSSEERTALMKVALGREPADIVLVNAAVVNVYTGELLEDCAVSVKGRWIAALGPDAANSVGAETVVVDAAGKTLIPGLIDSHTHLGWLTNAAAVMPYAMKGGVTTIITETMEAYPVAGCDGVVDFLDSLRDQPIKIFATAPAMVSISRSALGISREDLERLLARDEVLGLGESYWQSVLQAPEAMMPAFQQTFAQGKFLEGHSAGAKGKKLMAYAAAGISSCHEPIRAEEALERLRLGFYVMAREGSIRQDLRAIAEIRHSNVDLRRLILVTDGVEPREYVRTGYMETVVEKAIEYGFEPITAIQMATLNAAEHFGLDGVLGGLAPGRCADILMIPDLRRIRPEMVISDGRIVFAEGELQQQPRRHVYGEASLHSVHLKRAVSAADFDLYAADGSERSIEVRVIGMVTDLVTEERHLKVAPVDGKIPIDLSQDLLKVAAIERRSCPNRKFIGLIQGFRMRRGAMACSAAWDTSDIVAVGAGEADMALAVNRVNELQGGVVVCEDGKVTAELPLPIFGIMSDLPMEQIAERLDEVMRAAHALGVPFADAVLSLVTLTGAAIPYLRICEEGLVHLKEGRTLPLEV